MKFIVDGMLGKLTRWLRMLGHDVIYTRSEEDRNLVQIAETEFRVLLTRDRTLYKRAISQGVIAVLVEASSMEEKLSDLARRFDFKLEIDSFLSRCPKCNTILTPVHKNAMMNRVPGRTYAYYHAFWACPGCEQIYWRGSHWQRIGETLEQAKKILHTSI